MTAVDRINIELLGIGRAVLNKMLAVPFYQRSYAWEDKHILDLFSDTESAINKGESEYFLGTIVTTKNDTPRPEVVDGQQRIRSLVSFIEPSSLKDYEPERDDFTLHPVHDKELAGKKFAALDLDIQQLILDYAFSVHIFPSQVDDREILEIFARLNSTGVKLNPQELRNANYFGEFKTSMYRLASEQLERWREWKIFTEYNLARMDEVEITSEFIILILRGLTSKSQSSINNVYRDRDNENDFPERTEAEKRFRTVMDTIDDKLGNDMRHLPFRKQTMFYHLFLIVYHLIYGIASSLQPMHPERISSHQISKIIHLVERVESKRAPDEVIQSVARRTTNLNSRTAVFNYFCQGV